MKRLFLTLGLATSMLHAEPLFLLEFSGAAGPYTVEQWKKDWVDEIEERRTCWQLLVVTAHKGVPPPPSTPA